MVTLTYYYGFIIRRTCKIIARDDVYGNLVTYSVNLFQTMLSRYLWDTYYIYLYIVVKKKCSKNVLRENQFWIILKSDFSTVLYRLGEFRIGLDGWELFKLLYRPIYSLDYTVEKETHRCVDDVCTILTKKKQPILKIKAVFPAKRFSYDVRICDQCCWCKEDAWNVEKICKTLTRLWRPVPAPLEIESPLVLQ